MPMKREPSTKEYLKEIKESVDRIERRLSNLEKLARHPDTSPQINPSPYGGFTIRFGETPVRISETITY